MAKKVTVAAPETTPDRAPCLCNCGGFPKGKTARFIPGHDARYHAALKREAKAAFEAAPAATEKPKSTKRPAGAARPAQVKESATETAGSDA